MTTDLNWDDLRYLLSIDREGTLLGASRALGVSHSTVSRRLVAAETALKARLFNRRGHVLVRSEAADQVLAHAVRVETEIAALRRAVLGGDGRLEGEVRLAVPLAFMTDFLAPHLPEFERRYPRINLVIFGDMSPDALLLGTADIGVRVSRPVSEQLDIRRVGHCAFALYGCPSLAAGPPGVPFVALTQELSELPEAKWLKSLFGDRPPVLRVSTTVALRAAVQAGCGVSAMPCYVGDRTIGLARIATANKGPREGLFLVTLREQRRLARVRVLVNFLATIITAGQAVFGGLHSSASDPLVSRDPPKRVPPTRPDD